MKVQPFTVKAHRGDAKTLLAFNFASPAAASNLAGFTIACQPANQTPYFLLNNLRFREPAKHAQDLSQPANSTVNAPIQKFRWLHVPASFHGGLKPFEGPYTYTVTPRYFNTRGSTLPLDPVRSVRITVPVTPFAEGSLSVGFTRGFVQSQAFVHHFGIDALIRPKNATLLYDTSAKAGSNAQGDSYTYLDEYGWLGNTARRHIFDLLDEVVKDSSLSVDMFAYDLNEPDLLRRLLTLAAGGRIRLLLDNSSLHHNASSPKPEDHFANLFRQKARRGAAIKRGKFGRYSHDKILIVSKAGTGPVKVLTGSTNFSVNGLYINSNHVLVFDNAALAARYSAVFNTAWEENATLAFRDSTLAAEPPFTIDSPATSVTFAPHQPAYADELLRAIVARIGQEKTSGKSVGSVLFAVMSLSGENNPVYSALQSIHGQDSIFSYGISDSPGGIELYSRGSKHGVLVTGRPGKTRLPPPFNQVPSIEAHQIHHKFVVCGFNGPDPVVYCGSSNLAEGGESRNGDNLLAIRDSAVATAFAIEALALVDHFTFLDRLAPKSKKQIPSPALQAAAANAGWFLFTNDQWAHTYFDRSDFHYRDRLLFA